MRGCGGRGRESSERPAVLILFIGSFYPILAQSRGGSEGEGRLELGLFSGFNPEPWGAAEGGRVRIDSEREVT